MTREKCVAWERFAVFSGISVGEKYHVLESGDVCPGEEDVVVLIFSRDLRSVGAVLISPLVGAFS